ncbi:MAG: HAD family hydrolase [Deinococcales bacterium]
MRRTHPHSETAFRGLKAQAYVLALVADGLVKSFETIFKQHQLEAFFEVKSISEAVGVDKPDKRMFLTALEALKLLKDKDWVVMVGNNLSRDIKGANQLGIYSIFLDWSDRRSKIPADTYEMPDLTVKLPLEILGAVGELETSLIKYHLQSGHSLPLKALKTHEPSSRKQ